MELQRPQCGMTGESIHFRLIGSCRAVTWRFWESHLLRPNGNSLAETQDSSVIQRSRQKTLSAEDRGSTKPGLKAWFQDSFIDSRLFLDSGGSWNPGRWPGGSSAPRGSSQLPGASSGRIPARTLPSWAVAGYKHHFPQKVGRECSPRGKDLLLGLRLRARLPATMPLSYAWGAACHRGRWLSLHSGV